MNPTLRETQSDCQGATASGSHPPPHRISRLLALDYSWISRHASSTRLLRLIEIFDRSEFEIEGGGPGVTEYEPRRHRPGRRDRPGWASVPHRRARGPTPLIAGPNWFGPTPTKPWPAASDTP